VGVARAWGADYSGSDRFVACELHGRDRIKQLSEQQTLARAKFAAASHDQTREMICFDSAVQRFND
jgi:hypothetical protein